MPILDYIEDFYIGRRQRRGTGRRNPRFPKSWWNVYERTLNNDPRTNNCAKAGHRRLQSEFDNAHPTLWTFITTLRKSQKLRDVEYTACKAGSGGRTKKRKYELMDDRIRRIVAAYTSGERTNIRVLTSYSS